MEHPTLPARYERIASLNQLNKKQKVKEGKNGQSFRSRRKQLFSCPAFSAALFLSGKQQNEQTDEKQTVKIY